MAGSGAMDGRMAAQTSAKVNRRLGDAENWKPSLGAQLARRDLAMTVGTMPPGVAPMPSLPAPPAASERLEGEGPRDVAWLESPSLENRIRAYLEMPQQARPVNTMSIADRLTHLETSLEVVTNAEIGDSTDIHNELRVLHQRIDGIRRDLGL